MVLAVAVPFAEPRGLAAQTEPLEAEAGQPDDFENAYMNSKRYAEYAERYEGEPRPDREIVLAAPEASTIEGMERQLFTDYEGMPGQSLYSAEQGSVTWEFHVPEAGMYHMSATYYPLEGKSSAIQRSVLIDGELPFAEAAYVTFPRVWDNRFDELKIDNQGNELRPEQVEAPLWREQVFRDAEGFYTQPLQFYLPQGRHTLTLMAQREPMLLKEVKLYQERQPITYAQMQQVYLEQGYAGAGDRVIVVQAEDAVYKSSPTLYPLTDRSSPAVEPYSPSAIKINTIGGFNWRVAGDWIAWEIDVPQSGLYKIGLGAKQNFVRGIYSTRKLLIDGKAPFAEVEQIPFRYESGYRMDVLGGDEPYLFYLSEGKHELSLEVSLGEMAELIREVEASLLQINSMFRKVLMITGNTPDRFRDYQLERQVPGLQQVFRDEHDRLLRVADKLEQIAGKRSDAEAALLTMADQLLELAERPDKIPRSLTSFKINTGGLGTWLSKSREQPLQLDALYVVSADADMPDGGAGFFSKLWHEARSFYYSFIIDYNKIGNVATAADERTITVWIGSGRDQAQTMKAMIDDTFTPVTGINVNLELVQMYTLLPATLAGEGPDVAMQISNDIPVNYAMRNAAADLSQFADFPEVAGRFRDSAMEPFHYDGGYYALPETQVFNMLFYRKDVLQELGLDIPQTWDDAYNLLTVLSKNKMEFAFPLVLQPSYPGENLPPNSVFASLLYQLDGHFYREGGKESDLDSEIGIAAFKQWTELYTDYKQPREFDFPNRFRTGEMPMGIADYTLYNQLQVFAPEIRGLWGFVPIPGVRQPDGSIRRDVPSGGSNTIMLEHAEDKEAAWAFMKWWTSADVQTKFGREMEGLMGAAARYPTANIEALETLPWPVADFNNLQSAFEHVRGIPEVPGGYFTGRHLLNAFYKVVVNEKVEAREGLMDYVQYIHDEIAAKRGEFGLDS